SVCDMVLVEQETVPAKGHTPVTDKAVAPTCTADGKTEGSHCSVCDMVLVEQKTVPATGHTVVTDPAVAPTCTEEGKTEGSHCSVCDTVLVEQETVPATGHTAATDPAVAPTCTEEGKTEGSHCSVCDMVLVEQKTVPAMGHTAATDPAVAPTCTEEGKTEGSHCSVCDTVLVEQETVPATGHTAATDPAVAPTCTEEGKTEGSHCSVCDTVLVEQKAIPAAGHSFGDWQSDDESHWKECENCGIRENEAEHQWDSGTVITPPTADDDGEILFNCMICGETKTTVIPAVGENPTDPTNPNEPADPTDPETPDDNDNGSISKDALSGENAPSAELDTPLDELIEAVLTSEEQELIKNGIDIKIILTVEDETEYVSDEDKTIVEAAMNGISGCKLGQYLDVNLLKIIGDKQEHITETKGLITVTLEIPKTLLGEGRKYSIIRIHDGEASILPDLDNDDSTITFQSDKFSTYALVYSEGKAESPAQSEGNPITGTVIT
ncbi:MAG: hypothetical protein K2J79_03560, partial [Ruminiclostridium sp.]|nr:hypothetical protein [Ruminiclostridium sp.]